MKCTPEEKEQRLATQKELQKRVEEKKVQERAQRLKCTPEEKEQRLATLKELQKRVEE